MSTKSGEPHPRAIRLEELRLRLPGLIEAIQESDVTPQRKAMLAAEYEQVLGAVFALGSELDLESN